MSPVSAAVLEDGVGEHRATPSRAFLAILHRDVFVAGKELAMLLVQVALAPLLMLFIFGKVLSAMDYVDGAYGRVLLPGIVALSTFLTAMHSVALPLVMELGVTKEIEDRLLAPLPTGLVALEKLLVASLRGLIAAGLMYPMGVLVLGSAPWRVAGVALMALTVILGAWAGAALGITIGTLVPISKTNLVSAVVLTPLMFTGATQYPWPSMESLRWFQVLTAVNPMTYCAEGIRAAMVPEVPHMAPWVCVLALAGYAGVLTLTGVAGFRRRAVG